LPVESRGGWLVMRMIERVETVLIHPWFWWAAIALLVGLPFLLTLLYSVETQGDWLALWALCRAWLVGGR